MGSTRFHFILGFTLTSSFRCVAFGVSEATRRPQPLCHAPDGASARLRVRPIRNLPPAVWRRLFWDAGP